MATNHTPGFDTTPNSQIAPVVDSVVPDSVQARTHRSVRDVGPGYAGDGNIFLTLFNGMVTAADEAPPWSYYPMYRDAFLRQFYKSEPTIVGAVYSMAARGKALDHNFETEGPNKKKYWEGIAKNCELGQGIGQLHFLTIVDMLTQDNGFFWELVGPGDPDGPIIGRAVDVLHMDAARCWRTFNPMYPVIYHNPDDGTWHRMHHSRVVVGANMPMPDELARGIGFCAISRALSLARTMKAMQRYKYEKLTGTVPGIVFGNGFNRNTFDTAVTLAEAAARAQGMVYWNGLPVILNPDADAKVTLDVLSLKGLPDGFDAEADASLYIYTMALAFGVDAREFWPATASGATKGDASIQHMKAQGKGIADIISTIENAWRQVLPDDVTFKLDFTDDEQDMLVAQINTEIATMFTGLTTAGIVNKKQAELHLVKEGVLDPALMAQAENWIDPMAPQQIGPDGKPIPPQPGAPAQLPPGNQPPKLTALANAAPSDDQARLQAGKALGWQYQRMAQKDYEDTRVKLVDALTDIIQKGQDNDITKRKLGGGMRSNLNKLGLQALNDGLAKGGLVQESLSADQLDAWKEWKTRTSGYVTTFINPLYDEDGVEFDARARAELWANKSLKEIYWKGVELAAPETLYTWHLGHTEKHCNTCLTNDGVTLTMGEWAEKGLPQSSELDCGGYYCDCDIVEESA